MKTIKERFADWIDWDGAEYEIGVMLGLWPEFNTSWGENKVIIWSSNPIGNGLCNILKEMVDIKLLKYNEETFQYRYNENFTLNP